MSEKNASEGRIQWSRFFKKLSPYMIRKGLLYLKHYGPREFWVRLHERFEPEEIPYGPWYDAYVPDQSILDKQKKKKFAYAPLISIVVPAYRTPEKFLRQLIGSLQAQSYSNWELSGKWKSGRSDNGGGSRGIPQPGCQSALERSGGESGNCTEYQ